jgi:superfamily II DNA or RNA helicase
MEIIPLYQTPPLRRSNNYAEYQLYRAALEWDLDEPIIIENSSDMQSEPSWRGKFEPYEHQIKNLITFCHRLPVALLADDVGLGKTISAGLITSELMARRKINRILIVCPKILMPQWKDELKQKFGIESVEAIGKELFKASPPNNKGAVITTYQSAEKYLENLRAKSGRNDLVNFQMLILDEAHKLRNLHGTSNSPVVAVRFRKALADSLFKYVLMLTATPIQNRLWDIYSLIDLLTVARGHANPFGSSDKFAQNYIADTRRKARELKKDKKNNFHSIIGNYMSRIRRVDVELAFPTREILMHRFYPTVEEKELFNIIKGSWKLNSLVKSSMQQALVSSPEALLAQLKNSSNNGDAVAKDLYQKANSIYKTIGVPAKLKALGALIEKIIEEQEGDWRIVIFTERRDTQSSIQEYINKTKPDIAIGIINGDSGEKNRETIEKFNLSPPDIRIVISTRAGSEGVNLQIANILVNYDLPWNPMIVEQRIGRIQRLGSRYAKVCIYYLILSDSYEEDIVAVLMEKLQMAAESIGDIEAILENSEMSEDGNFESFENRIHRLVLASLEGKNIETEKKMIKESIENAKKKYNEENQFISNTLDRNFEVSTKNINFPKIPVMQKSMTEKDFAFAALKNLGATLIEEMEGDYYYKLHDRTLKIRFDDVENSNALLCKSGNTFFDSKLILPIVKESKYYVNNLDQLPLPNLELLIKNWVSEFNGNYKSFQIIKSRPCFIGKLLLRVKITVVCDSFESLLDIDCKSNGIFINESRININNLNTIEDIESLGISLESYREKIMDNVGVSEFTRFYLEKLEKELKGAGKNSVKQKRIEEDFTPRVSINLVGLEGDMHIELKAGIQYQIESINYESTIILKPSSFSVIEKPEIRKCDLTELHAPSECFAKCEITGKDILKHHLIKSEISERYAQSDYIVVCSLTEKKVISDEIEKSDISGKPVVSKFLKVSELSKTKGEPEYFGKCNFTFIELLNKELLVSQVSGKQYRIDQELVSAVSGRVGHESEFIFCNETGKPLLASEAEESEISGKFVLPGILTVCEKSNKKAMPSELEKCAVTEKKALKSFFVSSSISNVRLLEEIAIRSNKGSFCTPSESSLCIWTQRKIHPNDLRICKLTGLNLHFDCISKDGYLTNLYNLLTGNSKAIQRPEHWKNILEIGREKLGDNCKIEFSEVSPTGQHLAICLEISTWLGLKKRYAGLIYSIQEKKILGRISIGKRENGKWVSETKQ